MTVSPDRRTALRAASFAPIVAAVLVATALCTPAQAARPVARWDVVPDQRIAQTFNVGVVAFHATGVKVAFRIDDQLVATAENPTYNPRTEVWEYWFPFDPSQYADGPVEIFARAVPLGSGHESYDLSPLLVYANSGGSLTVSVVKWADANSGSDANPGTEAEPYQTLKKAVQNTPAGGTIYLKAGTYSPQGLAGGHSRVYWTTIAAAPGLGWDDVEIGVGRPGTERLKLQNLSIFMDVDSGGYATILAGENGNNIIWLDNVKAWNKAGRWGAGSTIFGNRYPAYLTGGMTTEMMNGPGGRIIRNYRLEHIGSDAWSGGGRLVVNSTCIDIDRGPTSAHPDFHQSYCGTPECWVSDAILYNVSGFDCIAQGLFGSNLRDSAFVNVLYEKVNTVMYSQYSGRMENVLFLNMQIVTQTWLWRNSYNGVDIVCRNNIYSSMGTEGDPNTAGIDFDNNHFIGGTQWGDSATSGDPEYTDPDNNVFRIASTSPAWGSGTPLQCVPADIEGQPRHPVNPNRGCYARGDVALLSVNAWQTAAPHGPAGTLQRTVDDGDVHASAAPLSELRATFNQPINPASLGAAPVTVTAQTAGDLTATVQAVTLADADTTLVITLSQPLPEGDRVTVTLDAGLTSSLGYPLAGDAALELGILPGDADGSGTVGEGDIVAVRQASGSTDPQVLARYDVDASGSVTGADQSAVRSQIGSALP